MQGTSDIVTHILPSEVQTTPCKSNIMLVWPRFLDGKVCLIKLTL